MLPLTTDRSERARLSRWALSALALLGSAALVRAQTRRVEAAFPPLGSFIEIDGVRLHYVVRGQGDTVVVLHGNGSNVLDLELSGLLDRVAERYRVLAFDRPGFGYSARPRSTIWSPGAQARLLRNALRELGVQRPVIAGHSAGAQVALAMALQAPDEVRSLALLSGYYFPSARLDALLMGASALPLLRHAVSPWLGRLLWKRITRRLFAPSPIPASFRAYPAWMSLRPSALRAGAAEGMLMVAAAAAMQRRYAELEVPVVIMAGTDDQYIDSGWNSLRLHSHLAGSELTLSPGAGHMVHHIVPEEVMAAIDAAVAAPPLAAPSPTAANAAAAAAPTG
jgi:pimeloyl-ACP methyl ester carboxylesterase